eukprot:384029-Pyramimonas_sp.AAC.1
MQLAWAFAGAVGASQILLQVTTAGVLFSAASFREEVALAAAAKLFPDHERRHINDKAQQNRPHLHHELVALLLSAAQQASGERRRRTRTNNNSSYRPTGPVLLVVKCSGNGIIL